MSDIVTFSAFDSMRVVNPEIWNSDCASYKINNLQGIRARWGLLTGCIDPRWPFADCDGSIETQGPVGAISQSVAVTSEAGVNGPDGVVRFGKVADPDDATKTAYIMRREETDETVLQRTELSFSPTFTPAPLGSFCWIGFAVRIPSTWRAMTGTDEVMLWQIHDTPDGGDDTQPAPIGLFVRGNKLYIAVRSNPNAVTVVEDTTYAEVFSEAYWPGDQWMFFAVKLKSHWLSAQSPSLEIWRSVNGGANTKIVDYQGPNSYNNTVRDYAKSGLYYYADQWTGGIVDKVIYHKGLYQWLDSPDIDETKILSFLQTV